MPTQAASSGVRLAELMAGLSIATDRGMGQPLESALVSCVVAMWLGEALKLDDSFAGHCEVAQRLAVVFNRVTWRGIHTGEFNGIPATGRPIELRGINLFKLKDGRIVEQRAELDFFGLLQQIGAIPS